MSRSSPMVTEDPSPVEGLFLHGTAAVLEVGAELVPGRASNYQQGRVLRHLYFTSLVPTAAWGAQLATALTRVEGRGEIYVVEPTGPFEDDPNVTDKKFPGNPTRSFRTRDPLRVVGRLAEWEGHTPEALRTMLDTLRHLREQGRDVIED